MKDLDTLRNIVAKLGETEPDKIGPDFSLQSAALKGSIKRAALAATIRRDLGVNCPAAHTVATFGELEKAVFGGVAAPAAAIPEIKRRQTVAPTSSFSNGTAPNLRCGVDIEMIADLPEAADYREHPFYTDSFSPEEIAYCVLQENPRMHFAARWCAKEALYKCDPAFFGEKMANLGVAQNDKGELFLRHTAGGKTRMLPHAVSLSHTNSIAVALVVKAAQETANDARPLESAQTSDRPVTPVAAGPAGNSFQVALTLLCLLAMGAALFALVRTIR